MYVAVVCTPYHGREPVPKNAPAYRGPHPYAKMQQRCRCNRIAHTTIISWNVCTHLIINTLHPIKRSFVAMQGKKTFVSLCTLYIWCIFSLSSFSFAPVFLGSERNQKKMLIDFLYIFKPTNQFLLYYFPPYSPS